jgi:hypothetical protein
MRVFKIIPIHVSKRVVMAFFLCRKNSFHTPQDLQVLYLPYLVCHITRMKDKGWKIEDHQLKN